MDVAQSAGQLLLLDADTLAGWRRSTPSLAQLHHAVLHLQRARPSDQIAVIADPSLRFALAGEEQSRFDADIVGGVLVCTPAGAVEGTHGFLGEVARQATGAGLSVLAVSDRAIPGVPLGRVHRDDAGRWFIDDTGKMINQATAKAASSAKRPVHRRRTKSLA